MQRCNRHLNKKQRQCENSLIWKVLRWLVNSSWGWTRAPASLYKCMHTVCLLPAARCLISSCALCLSLWRKCLASSAADFLATQRLCKSRLCCGCMWVHVHACVHTHNHAVLCPVHILRFCLEWVWIEQAVTECESPGWISAEYESGSQNETERDRRDFAFHPICTHSLLPCIHGSISSFCQDYDQVIALLSPQQIGYIQIRLSRGAQFDPAVLWCHLGKMFIQYSRSWSCSETHSSFHFYYKGYLWFDFHSDKFGCHQETSTVLWKQHTF